MRFSLILWFLPWVIRLHARRSAKMRALMGARDFTAQITVKDGSRGRWFRFEAGRLTSGAGVRSDAELTLRFKTAALGARILVHLSSGMFHFAWPLLRPFLDPMEVINAAKNFAF